MHKISKTIKAVKDQYLVTPYNGEQIYNISIKNLQLTILDKLFLDVMARNEK